MYVISTSPGGHWILHETTGDVLIRDTETNEQFWIPTNTISFDQQNRPVLRLGNDGSAGGHLRVDIAHDQELEERETARTDSSQVIADNSTDNILDEDSKKRNFWTYDATLALITAVEGRYDDLFHIHKKKTFWTIVSEELTSQSFSFTDKVCAKKWENLVKTYKSTKDNKKKTGRGPTRFPFFDRLDEVLGDSPTNSSPHSLDVNKENVDGPLDPLSTPTPSPSPDSETCSRQESMSKNKKRKNPSMEYVKVKKSYYEKKEADRQVREERLEKYFTESMKLKTERLSSLNKKLELEERKVLALEMMAGVTRHLN